MEQRSFKDKRSPSKNSGNQKQRFKPPLFINDENEPTSPIRQQQAQSHDNPAGGKVRERPRSRKSESSITGNDILQDEIPKGIAKSLPEPVQIHGQGLLPPRGRPIRLSEGENGIGGNNGKAGDTSPDSGSMISDDVPSGYNSGEHYDTLSAGYMSDMAGRITDTDTRRDWREPSLDVIEESRDNTGAGAAASTGGMSKKSSDEEEDYDDLFLVPPPPPVTANPAITGILNLSNSATGGDMHDRMIEYERASSTSSSDQNDMLDTAIEIGDGTGMTRPSICINTAGPMGGNHHTSPINFPKQSKLKKKVTTFAVPIEASPLSSGTGFIRNDSLADNAYMDESSDANIGMGAGGMHLQVGGYRTVPSDTDTTDAIESDGCAMATETGTDSGTDNPNSGAHKPLVKSKKQSRKEMRRFKRKQENHDDEWFAAHDNKYWRATRFICFWGSVFCMLAATVAAGIFISLMPRECNPEIDWYHGTVSLDIIPTMHDQDKWKIDFIQLSERLPYYHSVGIQTLHLRDISRKHFDASSEQQIKDKNYDLKDTYHPTNKIIDLIKDMIGQGDQGSPANDFKHLTSSLHQMNMTLMVQLPVIGNLNETKQGKITLELQQDVSKAIQYLMQMGVDGIFLDGLEHFGSDLWVAEKVKIWRDVIDQYGITNRTRILMTSYKFAHNLEKASNAKAEEALKHISLLDATLNFHTTSSLDENDKESEVDVVSFNKTSDSLNDIAEWDSVKGRPWINWNIDSETLPLSNAALALQMLLPGTINIGAQKIHSIVPDLNVEEHVSVQNHSSSGETFRNMTSLRAVAVPIYMNGNYKRCECPEEEKGYVKEKNFLMHQPMDDVIQLERFYSRRNRFVLVANFGNSEVDLSPIGRIYSGGELVLDTSNSLPHLLNTDVQFKSVSLLPFEAIVMKLPK